MENSKLIFAVVLILTLLVGGSLGFLVGERISRAPERYFHYQKQIRPQDNLKAMAAKHYAKEALKRKLQERKGKETDIFLKFLSKKCDLNVQQQEKIKEILQSKRSQIQDVRKEIQDKMEQIKEETDTEIERVLTQEQKEQFDEFKKDAAKRQKMRKRF